MTSIRERTVGGRGTWLVAAAGALLLGQACGASESDTAEMAGNAGATATPDGGTGGTGGASSDAGIDVGQGGEGGGGGVDAGIGGAAGQAPVPTFVAHPVSYLVHASPDLFAFRACVEGDNGFVTTYPHPSDAEHPMPETSYPGVPTGGAVNIDPIIDLIATETTFTVRLVRAESPIVAQAQPTASHPITCANLFESGGPYELPPADYVDLPPLQTDALFPTIRLLSITGCRADATLTAALCGADFDPTQGNLRANIKGLSPTLEGEPSTFYIYPIHLSPALTALQQANQKLELTLQRMLGPVVVASDVTSDPGAVLGAEFTPPSELADYGKEGLTLTAKETTAGDTELLDASLADIQRVSDPYDTPDAFFTGSNGFVMLFIGDTSTSTESWLQQPNSWNPTYDGRGLHVVALPFRFETP